MPTKNKTLVVLGQRLALLRKQRRLTQEELADRAGVGVKYLSTVERGLSNPSYLFLSQLASAMSLSLPEVVAEPGRIDLEIASLLEGRSRGERARALAVLHVLLAPMGER